MPLQFEVGFQPPYDWAGLLSFLSMRCIAGVEEVEDFRYRRAVRVGDGEAGWIEIGLGSGDAKLRVVLSDSLQSAAAAVLCKIEHLTDAGRNPAEVAALLGELARNNPGLRVPGAFDGFEIAVRAILGQQVSVKAARTLLGRFVARFGKTLDGGAGGLRSAFPIAEEIAGLDAGEIASLGMPQTRARTVLGVAQEVAHRGLDLRPGVDVAATLRQLQALPGVGTWTAQYIAMRALAWPDAFPHTDLVLMRALGETNPRRVLEMGERWRPFRAYAVLHLWNREAHGNRTVG